MPPMLAHPKCPLCDAELKLGKNGEVDAWSCPTGHALGIMISEAYGRVQDDEIAKIWTAAKAAPPAEHACPLCGDQMVAVTVGIDEDEAAEGETADLADMNRVALEVCLDDAFFWFDAGELEEFRQDIPTPHSASIAGPTEEDRLDRQHVQPGARGGVRGGEERGIMNKVANHVVRRHPRFANLLAHAMYGSKLDDLQAETINPKEADSGPSS